MLTPTIHQYIIVADWSNIVCCHSQKHQQTHIYLLIGQTAELTTKILTKSLLNITRKYNVYIHRILLLQGHIWLYLQKTFLSSLMHLFFLMFLMILDNKFLFCQKLMFLMILDNKFLFLEEDLFSFFVLRDHANPFVYSLASFPWSACEQLNFTHSMNNTKKNSFTTFQIMKQKKLTITK